MPAASARASRLGSLSALSIRRQALAIIAACSAPGYGRIGTAALARAEAGATRRFAAVIESDVLAIGPARAAGRAAINAGGAHGVEERAVRRRVAAQSARQRASSLAKCGRAVSVLCAMASIIACSFMWGETPDAPYLAIGRRPNTPGLAIEFGKSPNCENRWA